ncbi:hypothetical protein IT084_06595 [Desulfallas sp. Bu1-1]|jgi:predicted  nucleic acid-binding Zn-ribbon protein|uniref:hypothetical protein n=1 Tax=Desulfallas sp. Bu1-1 TaxID=2787620 RepID=UPI00189C5F44|nr:hypothetical protein [Desulfallas sp. Bu1-1]MBF7082644.1 hypothetical protein [Desulfallas sp. Bu1-1]
MEKILNQILVELKTLNQRVGAIEEGQTRMEKRMDRLEKSQDALATEVMAVKADVSEVKSTLVKFESDITPKIGALFDGYSLRGDQIENLQKHLDERLNSIEIDTGYLVARVARLEKLAK